MPPKRKPVAEVQKEAEEAAKKAKPDEPTADPAAPAAPAAVAAHATPSPDSAASAGSQSGIGAAIPDCIYGAKCYRKNPQHFKEFRHPAGVTVASAAPAAAAPALQRVNSIQKKDFAADLKQKPENQKSDAGPELEAYKMMMKAILAKGRVTKEDRQLCRQFRQTHSIDQAQHTNVLQQFGWNMDEWEDGEKAEDDTIDLAEERNILSDPSGFKIITITKDQKKSKEQEHVFSKVAARFFQTMSKAQANYQVAEVSVIVNAAVKAKYEAKRKEFQMAGKETNEEWGFHGTSVESVAGIAKTGFLHPDQLKAATTKKGKGKGKAADLPKVVILDDGYFGKGIYFSFYSDYAMWYSEERESDQLLLCKLIRGKCWKVDKRDDGVGLKPGFDSHYSPGGNEIVIFDPAVIMPRYIIKFTSHDAEEREQEG